MKRPRNKPRLTRNDHLELAAEFRRGLTALRAAAAFTWQHMPGPATERALAALNAVDKWRSELDAEFHSSMTDEEFQAHGRTAGFPYYDAREADR
jgi:hypothetical protein